METEEERMIRVVKALWPVKSGEELACRCGLTPRAGNMWLMGNRKFPGPILRAIANEFWSREARPLNPHGPHLRRDLA
jgi:hypothetical protein